MGESRFIVAGLALALGATATGARADEPLELAPSSAWVMDYADDSCALKRTFQAGDQHALLQLRQIGPGDSFEVTVASGTLAAKNEKLQVRFEPDDEFTQPVAAFYFDGNEFDAMVYNDSFRSPALRALTPPYPDWPEADREARERAITGLSIKGGFERPLLLKTGAMHPAMNAMRTCLDELLNHWGLDAAVQRTLSRRPKPLDQLAWAKKIQAAYPAEMLRKGRSGLANIRMIVGSDGKPTACIPNKDAPDRAFDEHTCEVMMRFAKFEPALDANGQPTASFWTTTVTYMVD